MAETLQTFFFDADDLHRNMARCGILLELIQNRPAQHVRQEYVEHDSERPELVRQRSHVRTVRRDHAFQAFQAARRSCHRQTMLPATDAT